MKIKIIFVIIVSFSISSLNAQNKNKYRKNFSLILPIDSIQFYQQEVAKSPYFVRERVLQIYPGEKLFIEVEHSKKQITKMSVIEKPLNPGITLEVSLTQNVKDGKNESMILKLSNPFKLDLKYKAMMFIVGQDKWIGTNVLPVKAELSSFELWSDVIISLVLSDWEFE